MACIPCDPTTTTTTNNCCVMADAPPGSAQYVKFTVAGIANPQLKIKAYQLANATPTELTPAGTQKFWVYALQVSFDTAWPDVKVFWSIGGGPDIANSYLMRATVEANQMITYNGPGFPLPLGAELYVLTQAAASASVVGYGLLETI